MSLGVDKNGGIFWGHRFTQVGSGSTVRDWNVLDFAFPGLLNIAILAPKIDLKYQSKH